MKLIAMLMPALLTLNAHPDDDPFAEVPSEKFESGKAAFEAARRELMEEYVNADVTEDQLYRAAVQGMLAAVDPPMRQYNRLLTPTQFADLHAEMKGELVGIGVELDFDAASGRAQVLGVLPGSPAAKGEVREGDIILTVDGKVFKGKSMRELVAAIRGKSGEKVKLQLLRDARVVDLALERQKVNHETVELVALPGDVAMLRISGFVETTPAMAKVALGKLGAAKGLVVDLRGNEGGLLERAIDTAKLLLPKGKTVVRLAERGGKEKTVTNDAEPLVKGVPLVVLIDDHTGSSAEMLAAALHEAVKAPLIGARTRGKWSVQVIKELPNHYVMKYTVAQFKDPSGKSWEGEGLPPDFEVPMAPEGLKKARRLGSAADQLLADPQLKAASNFLRMR